MKPILPVSEVGKGGMKIVPGRMYHVDGWKQGTFFRLLKADYDLGIAFLETPTKRKKYNCNISQLRNIKKYGAKKINPLTKPEGV